MYQTTDFVVQRQALIREVINGYAMILCLTLVIMITIFVWDTYWQPGPVKWTERPGVRTACALWWIFGAETYRTGAVWMLYQFAKAGDDRGAFFSTGAYWSSYGYLVAGLILNAGLLRAIYIFTPPEWKTIAWAQALIAATMFCATPSIVALVEQQLH